MATKRRAPIFRGSIETWTRDMTAYLDDVSYEQDGLEPKSTLLGQQQTGRLYKSVQDGQLMYNVPNGLIVYSYAGEWIALSTAGGGPSIADAVLREPTMEAQSTITPQVAANAAFTIVAAPAQTGNLISMKADGGATMSYFDNLGNPQDMIIDGGIAN